MLVVEVVVAFQAHQHSVDLVAVEREEAML
jgi:hypothetical protein